WATLNHDMPLYSHSCQSTGLTATLNGTWKDPDPDLACPDWPNHQTYSVSTLWPEVHCPSQYAVQRSKPWQHPGGCTCVGTTQLLSSVTATISGPLNACSGNSPYGLVATYICQ